MSDKNPDGIEVNHRPIWSSKLAFTLAAAASAVGLGNLWRFPYLAAKYGGGTFLLTYLLLVFTFGVSMLLIEISLGRRTRQSTIGAFRSYGKKYAFIGIFASAIPFLITPYYSIIGGWVTKYFAAYLTESPATLADGGTYFSNFITSTESFVWMLVFFAIVFIVVARGVKGGIEKCNLVLMPLLILMAIGLAVFTLSQPGAVEGAAYYLVPDFSKFTPELVIAALGQMFFSCSIAMGIMVTYGSYVDKHENLPASSARIAGFDFGVSFLAGLMIVPCAFMALGSGDAVAEHAGPGLMFIILPQLFTDFGPFASAVGILFFLLVLFAAATSAISLIETCTSIVQDGTKWSRTKSLVVTMVYMVLMGCFVNLGYNGLSFIQPLGDGSSLLDLFDFLSNSVMMPIAALMTLIFVGWITKPKDLLEEIKSSHPFKAEKAWVVMIKYIAPILVVVILVAYVGSTFGLISF